MSDGRESLACDSTAAPTPIEAMAKVSFAEISAQEFFSDDLYPDEAAPRRMPCAARHEELPTIQSAS